MYVWIGLGLDDTYSTDVRNYIKPINEHFHVSEAAFTLPLHVSLKTSFKVDNALDVANDLKNYFSNAKKVDLFLEELTVLPGVIWIDIGESSLLRYYHNFVLKFLYTKFGIQKTGFDGDEFRFHATLFQDKDNKSALNSLYNSIDPSRITGRTVKADKLYIGISEVGEVGTYKVLHTIDLKD